MQALLVLRGVPCSCDRQQAAAPWSPTADWPKSYYYRDQAIRTALKNAAPPQLCGMFMLPSSASAA